VQPLIREMGQAKEIMRRLVMLAEQFKQDEHSKQLMQRLTASVPMEELMPEEQAASATHAARWYVVFFKKL
jgi:hypothetical protein